MIQLVITFDPATKQITVNGPINDRMLAYGMLDMARELVHTNSEKAQQLIAPAHMVPANGRG